jgi:hypothetical protein
VTYSSRHEGKIQGVEMTSGRGLYVRPGGAGTAEAFAERGRDSWGA